jgi:uncharacterized membrane protein
VVLGLDGLGLVHTALGTAALLLGLALFSTAKGTARHRRLGQLYVTRMVLLNLTALFIYELFGRVGPFHFAALFSITTVVAGFVPALLRRPRGGWIEIHALTLSWSYVGLVAAFLAEVAVRVPGSPFWPAVIVSMLVAVGIGAVAIHTKVPKIVAATLNQARSTEETTVT